MRNRVGDSLHVILVVCSVLCASTVAAIHPQQETAEQFVARVKKAIKNDEWGRAKSGIGHALALEPKSAEVQFVAAQVYWHEGARSMAIDAVETAIGYQPVYAEAHLLLAQCLADDNKADKAREEVNIAIAQGISRFPAYRLLGELDIAKGDVPAAISSLETALGYSTTIDGVDANRVSDQLSGLREFAAKFEQFASIEALQKAPDIVRPVLSNNPQPRYTEEARRLKIQGAVGMVLLITQNGEVDTVLLYRGLGHGLDERAIEAARNLKFSPATQGGRPIQYWQRLNVEFILK